MPRAICNLCDWVGHDWPIKDYAGCESSWHVYEEHKEVWADVTGSDAPPTDPDPRPLLQESIGRHPSNGYVPKPPGWSRRN